MVGSADFDETWELYPGDDVFDGAESWASYDDTPAPAPLQQSYEQPATLEDPQSLQEQETSSTPMEVNQRSAALQDTADPNEPASIAVAKSPTKAMGGEQDDRAVPLLSQDNAEEPVEEPVALRSAEVEELPPALHDNESVASYEEPIEPSALHSHDYEEAKPVDPNALASEEDHLLPATAGVATSPTKMMGEESNDRGVALLSQENGEEPVEENVFPASTDVAKSPTKAMGGEQDDRAVPLLSQDNAEEPVEEPVALRSAEVEELPPALHDNESVASYEEPIEPSALHSHDYEEAKPVDPNALASEEDHLLPATAGVATSPTKMMGEESNDRGVALLSQENGEEPVEENVFPASTDVAKSPTKAMGGEQDDRAVPLLSQDNAEEPVEEPVALRSAEVEELPPALRDNESVASYEEPIEPSALHSHDYEEAKPVDPNALASEEDHLLPATAGVATSPTKMLGEESNDRGVALLSQENGEEPVEEEVPVTLREEEKRPCAVHREEEDQEPLTSTEEHILPASTNVAKTPTKVMGGEANDRAVSPFLSQDNAEEPVEEEIPVSLKEGGKTT
ncbi:hypothetical protein, conserved [Angomonas deanei]|uniref:Uncharacterized protein n=1 Tax=Angomonas deanei TaxID=59799 RepID=A0A7G2CT43_9TRYP|nr:hypothetical protein, conserved [Angomonas deanei]